MKSYVLLLLGVVLSASTAAAQTGNENSAEAAGSMQFVIVLRPAPRLIDPANWTPADERAVTEHFQRLERLREAGQVLLAGRTLNSDESQFGLVIVEVRSEVEAREIMDGDPAVEAGVMTAEIFPYSVALQRLSREATEAGD